MAGATFIGQQTGKNGHILPADVSSLGVGKCYYCVLHNYGTVIRSHVYTCR